MSKDFRGDHALRLINREKSNMDDSPHSDGETRADLRREYYSLDTGEPIPLDKISERIKRRFREIERISAMAMLDLFFVHQNWSTFYARGDSFSTYIKEELGLSRTHVYGIINAVRLLQEYYTVRGGSVEELHEFMETVSTSVENVGIKKLIIIAATNGHEKRIGLLASVLDGSEYTAEALLAETRPEKPEGLSATLNSDCLSVGGEKILTFHTKDPDLRSAVKKGVERYYRRL